MVASDPFQARSKWRVLLPVSAAAAVGVLITLMGVVGAPAGGMSSESIRIAVLQDHFRFQHAVLQYVHDMHALPAPSFDLTSSAPNVLADDRLVPAEQQKAWHGPYLQGGLSRPTPASFWSLADAGALGADEAGAAWGRLHRGYGEIDDATAKYVDTILDDGDPARGSVRVTDTWIWFKLAELPKADIARVAAR